MNNTLAQNTAMVATNPTGAGAVSIMLGGRLDDVTLPSVWPEVLGAARQMGRQSILLDVSQVPYCDGAGLGLFAEVRRVAALNGGAVTFRGFTPDLQRLVERSELADPAAPDLRPVRRLSFVSEVGKSLSIILTDQLIY